MTGGWSAPPEPRSWIRGYERDWLAPDALAGLSVWALVVPEAMAYASIAGLPVQYGLYAVPLAVLGYVLFGTSRRLILGPTSTVAVLTSAVLAPVAAAGSAEYVATSGVLALLVGGLFLALGALRMGFVARFFAKPVLDGFIVGLGLFIAIGQLHKLVGVEGADGNTVRELWSVLTDLPDWDPATCAVGFASLAVLFLLARFAPRAPGALVVVVGGLAASVALDLGAEGVAVVGAIPTGFDFAPWSAVRWEGVVDLVPGALAIVVVVFAQSLAIARSYAAEDGTSVDPNQEMVAYGVASLGAGALQGFPPAGSLSKSAAAKEAGARSPLAFLVAAALVTLTVLFLTGIFEQLPEPVLAAIVIHAVWSMIDPSKLVRLARAGAPDLLPALASLAGVVLIGVVAGILIGVILSLAMLIHRMDNPYLAVLGRSSATGTWIDVTSDPDAQQAPGVLVLRLEAPLVFANAEAVADGVRSRADGPGTTVVVLDLEAVYEVDTQGSDSLSTLASDLRRRGSRLLLARVHGAVRSRLERDGVVAALGEGAIHATVAAAVEAGAG